MATVRQLRLQSIEESSRKDEVGQNLKGARGERSKTVQMENEEAERGGGEIGNGGEMSRRRRTRLEETATYVERGDGKNVEKNWHDKAIGADNSREVAAPDWIQPSG